MNATDIRRELAALLKAVRMRSISLADAQLQVSILAELVKLAELEARSKHCTQGETGKD